MEGVRIIGISDLDPLKKSCTLTDIGNVVDNTRVKDSLRSRYGCSLVAYSNSIPIFCLSSQQTSHKVIFLTHQVMQSRGVGMWENQRVLPLSLKVL